MGAAGGEPWAAARLDLIRVRSVDGERQPHDAVQVLAIVSAELIGQCYVAGLEVIAVFIGDGDRLGEFPEQSKSISRGGDQRRHAWRRFCLREQVRAYGLNIIRCCAGGGIRNWTRSAQ